MLVHIADFGQPLGFHEVTVKLSLYLLCFEPQMDAHLHGSICHAPIPKMSQDEIAPHVYLLEVESHGEKLGLPRGLARAHSRGDLEPTTPIVLDGLNHVRNAMLDHYTPPKLHREILRNPCQKKSVLPV